MNISADSELLGYQIFFMVCYSKISREYWTMERSKNPAILTVIHQHQNTLEFL
jgi:hypothetical protein